MKWERGHRSQHVEDLRGKPARGRGGAGAAKVGGGAAALLVVVALIAKALGVDLPIPSGGGGSSGATGGPSAGAAQEPVAPGAPDPDAELMEFIHFVVDDIQDTFGKQFRAQGLQYEPATLRVFADEVDTGCGYSTSAVGPFYCPADSYAYVDLSFFRDLRERFGAPGDFAQAYVLAHEYGHHLQNVLGTDDEVRRQVARDQRKENALSVRQELQADCYAGVWAHGTAKKNLIQPGDIEESMKAAQAIGDDRLQKMAGQRVNPETFTHGTSAQRARWFKRGFDGGSLDDCDTFAATDL